MTTISRTTICLALASLLGACAVSSPLQIQSTNPGAITAGEVALAIAEADAGTTRGQYGAALRSAFGKHGVSLDPGAPVVAEFAFSISDATDGIVAGKPEVSDSESEHDWMATPRKERRFDKCDAKRMRGTLVLFDTAKSAMVYRGRASQIECDFGEKEIAALANGLVADALGRTPSD